MSTPKIILGSGLLIIIFLAFVTRKWEAPLPFESNTEIVKEKTEDYITEDSIAKDIIIDTNKDPEGWETSFTTYTNTRFNYSIAYPETILIPQGESDNNDGQKFISANTRNRLTVYRDASLIDLEHNGSTFYNLYREEIGKYLYEDYIVSHRNNESDFFEIGGTKEDVIFFHKSIIVNDNIITAIFEYHKTGEETFRAISENIFNSFKEVSPL